MAKTPFPVWFYLTSIGGMLLNLLVYFLITGNGHDQGLSMDTIRLSADNHFSIILFSGLIFSILLPFLAFSLFKKRSKDSWTKFSVWPDIFTIILKKAIFSFGLIIVIVAMIQNQIDGFQPGFAISTLIAALIGLFMTAFTLYSTLDALQNMKS
jgi:hypothetical protein